VQIPSDLGGRPGLWWRWRVPYCL